MRGSRSGVYAGGLEEDFEPAGRAMAHERAIHERAFMRGQCPRTYPRRKRVVV